MSSEWPGSDPDGLEPLGEQLTLFDPASVRAEVTEIIVHRVIWGPRTWSCSCGAGREWPGLAPAGRPGAAARVHLRGVRRRVG